MNGALASSMMVKEALHQGVAWRLLEPVAVEVERHAISSDDEAREEAQSELHNESRHIMCTLSFRTV